MENNKWILEGSNTFKIGDQEITKKFTTAIPPTNGDRTDILTECGKYYFNTTKKDFMARMSKEEYLDKTMPIIYNKDDKDEDRKKFKKLREKALKEMTWTPIKTKETICLIIEIKGGEIKLIGK